jgi:ABC-type siderophore export system fused ATPase/permease subunit
MGRMSASVKSRNSGVTTARLALAQRKNMTMSGTGQEQRPIYMLDEADLEAVTWRRLCRSRGCAYYLSVALGLRNATG